MNVLMEKALPTGHAGAREEVAASRKKSQRTRGHEAEEFDRFGVGGRFRSVPRERRFP